MEGKIDVAHLDNDGKSAYQLAAEAASGTDSHARFFKDLAVTLRRELNTRLGAAIAGPDRNDAEAERLLVAGADPNAPLFEAVHARDMEKVEAILDNMPEGADIDARDGRGETALHRAVVDSNGSPHSPDRLKLIALLIDEGGADIEVTNRWGDTAYESIELFGHGPSVTREQERRSRFWRTGRRRRCARR